MTEKDGDIHALVDKQISADTDFQSSLEDMDDVAKETAISEKKTELVKSTYASLTEKAKKSEDDYQSTKVRAEKAEAEAKKPKDKKKEIETPKNDEQSNEPDYATTVAQKAFLNSKEITHTDDQEYLFKEAKLLRRNPEDILDMEHVKMHLKNAKDQREAEDGMPDGKGKIVGTSKTSVDYWKDKRKKDGTYDTPDDLELANKVIDARIKTEENVNKFSDKLF